MTVTLEEMDTKWSLRDLADAHAALDVRDELAVKANAAPTR
jgi:hypothetical protein